jgi:methionyl aminopeptidase
LSKVPIKNAKEIEAMRCSCAVTVQILDALSEVVKAGISTEEIDRFVHNLTLKLGAAPATLNYKGYTRSVCTSVNDVVCHGVPSPYVILKEGDIINVDVTSIKEGFHGDASRMYLVGGPEACTPQARELVELTKQALYAGIGQVAPGRHIGDIGAAIQEFVRGTGKKYGIVREYTGHGIGRQFHEAPQVVHVARAGTGEEMQPGMTFTIEPMINIGRPETTLSKVDGWTVRTADGSLSAQWEHTVLVTPNGYEVLTRGADEGI